jgi:glycosyltransferase involved in cell wall biosynthesis
LKKIIFTVTNDLSHDQRMNRICGTLAANGYDVTLVGRQLTHSKPLDNKSYRQKRLHCFFKKGKAFYAEYNFRLFFYLLFNRMDAICAIDLDTIVPCLQVSRLKRVKRVYDAHELFTELKEVVTRPAVKKMWMRIEKSAVPKFRHGYTVSESIAEEFGKRYGVQYETIRNVPQLFDSNTNIVDAKIILYQGAVNEGRAFEFLVPAMKEVSARLIVCGDGNFMPQLKALIAEHSVEQKIELKGMLSPQELIDISKTARIGIALAENQGLNQYFALPNKFFDYIMEGLPQVTMDYPEYRKINAKHEVAVLIDTLAPQRIAAAINNLLFDDVMYRRLKDNCLAARLELNWEQEQKKLIAFYQAVFNS